MWRFNIILPYMANSFLATLELATLEIPVMINILLGMMKTLHEKMLNAIYLYWFHNDAS